MFFYLYMLVTIMDLLLISGIIPTSSDLYPVSIHLFFCCRFSFLVEQRLFLLS